MLHVPWPCARLGCSRRTSCLTDVRLGSAIHEYYKIQADTWDAWMELLRLHPAASLVLPTRAFASVARRNLRQRAR